MIEVENVSHDFGTFRAVDDVSFKIQTGEIIGLLGPNGAGKTTTMRMITGFLEPTSGTIKIDGIDVTQNPVATKKKIGYMPESAPLYSDMIVADYLEYVANIEGVDPSVRVPQLADTCGLKEVMHKNIGELSRGNRQRVGLAHALMGNPEILILDEPTSGLDPNQVQSVRDLIKEIGKTRTVIVSTHILSEVEMLCNRVIIISGGKKIADSATEDLQNSFGSSNEITLVLGLSAENSAKDVLSKIDGVSSVQTKVEDDKVVVLVSSKGEKEIRPELIKACVSASFDVYEILLKKNSLEDVFRTLTSGGSQNE